MQKEQQNINAQKQQNTLSNWNGQNLKAAPLNDAEGYRNDRQEQLNSMKKAWNSATFSTADKDNLKQVTNLQSLKDLVAEQIMETESTQARELQVEFNLWLETLHRVQPVLNDLSSCQHHLVYLTQLFAKAAASLPKEAQEFKTASEQWSQLVENIKTNENSLEVSQKIAQQAASIRASVEQAQRSLEALTNRMQQTFPRFYFVSHDDLLEGFVCCDDVSKLPLSKVFEGINKVETTANKEIHTIISKQGERLKLVESVKTQGLRTEDWLINLERVMKETVRKEIIEAVVAYPKQNRTEWMFNHPAQTVLAGERVWWTQLTEEALKAGKQQQRFEETKGEIRELVKTVRGPLTDSQRTVVTSYLTLHVHASDINEQLCSEKATVDSASWKLHLKFYMENGSISGQSVQSKVMYSNEYLGNMQRLVITPLTDRCYFSLMQALHFNQGGSPQGPAGVGKTESVKDLARELGTNCTVINCSDQLDYLSMAKIFKGTTQSGSWVCFDEFNRICVEVLAVVANQVSYLFEQRANQAQTCDFYGNELKLNNNFGIFVTMNPGYAGRTQLPEVMKASFRAIPMTVPDYALIAEIMLYSNGFEKAKSLSKKAVSVLKTSSGQLSRQDHYDFGMRAMKSIINRASKLRIAHPEVKEEAVLLQAIKEVHSCKFTSEDLAIFTSIISDEFPGVTVSEESNKELANAITKHAQVLNLDPNEYLVNKAVELKNTTEIRHGVMVIGQTGSGKTSIIRSAANAIGATIHTFSPKSLSHEELYGSYQGQEWRDGVLTSLIRKVSQSEETQWIVSDGPIDAIWVEHLNSVLDDNKHLNIAGEMIPLPKNARIIFEVEDVCVVSPATVSRCGMVLVEPKTITLNSILKTWLKQLPQNIRNNERVMARLQELYHELAEPAINFVQKSSLQVSATCASNLTQSLFRLIDCLINGNEGRVECLLENLFQWAIVWSVGASLSLDGRNKFNTFLRDLAASKNSKVFPDEGSIYDYELNLVQNKWVSWAKKLEGYQISPETSIEEWVFPTVDSVRTNYFIKLLLSNGHNVLTVGPSQQKSLSALLESLDDKFKSSYVRFSPLVTARNTQAFLENSIEKVKANQYAPKDFKKHIYYAGEVNTVKKEPYGATPALEVLREFLQHGAWIDLSSNSQKSVKNISFLCSMDPKRANKDNITGRFKRHFNIFAIPEASSETITYLFATAAASHFAKHNPVIQKLSKELSVSSSQVLSFAQDQFSAIEPNKHYSFSPYDIKKVFEGLIRASPEAVSTPKQLAELWVHENMRVYQDRLSSEEDKVKFSQKCQELGSAHLLNNETISNVVFADNGSYKAVQNREDLIALTKMQAENVSDCYVSQELAESVARVVRSLKHPQGNALLLGSGGSGRYTVALLAAKTAGLELRQIQMTNNYSVGSWKEDLRKLLTSAGVENQSFALLLSDSQLTDQIVEDIDHILTQGSVPFLFDSKETEAIVTKKFESRVKKNIHFIFCINPYEQAFPKFIENYPSLIKASTVNWFSELSAETLAGIAKNRLSVLENSGDIGQVCKSVHKAAEHKAKTSQNYHVTISNFFELLTTLEFFTQDQTKQFNNKKQRLEQGLEKLKESHKVLKQLAEASKEVIRPEVEQEIKDWQASLTAHNAKKAFIIGNSVLGASFFTYAAALNPEQRTQIVSEWSVSLKAMGIEYEESFLRSSFLCPRTVLNWHKAGLPEDEASVATAITINKCRKWPVIIDPQNQTKSFLQQWALQQKQSVAQLKANDSNLSEQLAVAVSSGKWVLLELPDNQLPKSIQPLVSLRTAKHHPANQVTIKEKTLSVHQHFRLFIITTNSKVIFSPEIYSSLTVINFSVSDSRLRQFARKQIASVEWNQAYSKHTNCHADNVEDGFKLKAIEDQTLLILANTTGNLLTNSEFFESLRSSQRVRRDIALRKQALSHLKDSSVDYHPVIERAATLYSCLQSLPTINCFYRFDLNWFSKILAESIKESQKSDNPTRRVKNIVDRFTWKFYNNVDRALYQKDRILFSFVLAAKIDLSSQVVDEEDLRYLLVGSTSQVNIPKNPTTWLSNDRWTDSFKQFSGAGQLNSLKGVDEHFTKNLDEWKLTFESQQPQHLLPAPYTNLNFIQKLILVRCIRPDKLIPVIRQYVVSTLGEQYLTPAKYDLSWALEESSNTKPILLLAPDGPEITEAESNVVEFAHSIGKKIAAIYMGQGRGRAARAAVAQASKNGNWVFLQHCHLIPSFKAGLEELVQGLSKHAHSNFRLWISSVPVDYFPSKIVECSVKINGQQTWGVKTMAINLFRRYVTDDQLNNCKKPEEMRRIAFSLALLHGAMTERNSYVPHGWNIHNDFHPSDFVSSKNLVKNLLNTSTPVNFSLLEYLISEVYYGGRLVDDKDRRLGQSIVRCYINKNIVKVGYKFSESGHYVQPNAGSVQEYIHYLQTLPESTTPEFFGFDTNVEECKDQIQAYTVLARSHAIVPGTETGFNKAKKEAVSRTIAVILSKLPTPFNIQEIKDKYPVTYENSLNLALIQEAVRYNQLITSIITESTSLDRALKGESLFTEHHQKVANQIYENKMPDNFYRKSYPSLKPLSSYVSDLKERLAFIQNWIDNGTPSLFKLSAFFWPHGFLTAVIQQYSRKHIVPIDEVVLNFKFLNADPSSITQPPTDGVYVHGIFLDAASWDEQAHEISRGQPGRIYTELPIIHIQPSLQKQAHGTYDCPLYTTVLRKGTLSTTGHSTNFVTYLRIASSESSDRWTRAGAAALLNLPY